LKVTGGEGGKILALKIAKYLDTEYIDTLSRTFPDGEIYVRVMGSVKGEDVILVQSMGKKPNKLLIEYLLIADTLKDLGARNIIAVIPYLPYARQDARFNPGEAVSIKTVSKLIEKVGVSAVITVDMHLHRFKSIQAIFSVPAYNLSAMGLLAEYTASEFGLSKPLVAGPDEEAEQWAKIAANALQSDYLVLGKTRRGDYEVEIRGKSLAVVQARDVLIVDDIISTGGTMAKAVEALKTAGAKRILAACTHPLLIEDALYKVLSAGAEAVVGTDTVPSPISFVSVAPLIASFLKETVL